MKDERAQRPRKSKGTSAMSTVTEKIVKPKSMSEIVLDRLRSDIIQNRFELGEKISENSLSELYGVTKAPIRAAYIRLELEGMIEIRPQSGTYVFQLDKRGLMALCELRVALEVEATRLAMARNREHLGRIYSETVAKMEAALDERALDTYQKLDTGLHLGILDASDSPLLQSTYSRQVNGRFAALRYRFSQQHSHNDASFAEHKAMRDAALVNDLETLLDLTRNHTDNTRKYYESAKL